MVITHDYYCSIYYLRTYYNSKTVSPRFIQKIWSQAQKIWETKNKSKFGMDSAESLLIKTMKAHQKLALIYNT